LGGRHGAAPQPDQLARGRTRDQQGHPDPAAADGRGRTPPRSLDQRPQPPARRWTPTSR
jgi:hypothetical protein